MNVFRPPGRDGVRRGEEVGRVAREYAARGMPMRLRTRAEAAEFFTGIDLAGPGIVQVHH